jgi:putative sterol carrier protein
VATNEAIAAIANDHTVGITQTVTGGPEGDVTYHLQVADGRASFGAGAAYPEDVRFEQDWETATAVATDKLNAQQAFITGRIRLYGNQEKLVASTPVFAALDRVFSTVRTFTEYR